MKKFTLCLTHQCNLRCTYCYVDKRAGRMPIGVAEKIVDFIFDHATDEENIDIGFFGGEPLLEFKLLKKIVEMIERHRKFDRQRVSLSTVTNGTLFSNEIADYFAEHDIVLCFSCDGPPEVQDQFRHYRNGCGSSTSVLEAISKALARLPLVMVNSV